MFHFGLYKEGLRRSALVSSIFIAVMLLGAVFIPLSRVLSELSALRRGVSWATGRIVIHDFYDVNAILILALIAFAPILVLYLFSFLNKRNSSDFYHSIPHKRETLYTSFLAAALTWVVGGIWLSAGISLAILAFAPAPLYIIMDVPTILLAILGLTMGCVLVMGATLIAMSLTGSVFSNITTALLILFLPRTLIHVFIEMLINLTRVVTIDNFGFIGNWSYNIPFGFVLTFLYGGSDYVFINGALYTGILGLLYLGLGLLLFKRRKSEAAASPGANKIIQTTVRVALAFAVCLPAASIIAGGRFQLYDILPIMILYSIALVVYFAYELITTRKLSSLVKALPGVGILVLVNILFIAGLNIAQHTILNRQFHVNQIASVQIITPEARWGGSRGGGRILSYEDHRSRQVPLQDDRLTEVVLDALAKDIAAWRTQDHTFWNQVVQTSVFQIRTTTGGTVQRTIRITEPHQRQIVQLLSEQDAFRSARLTLPENPSVVYSDTFLSDEALWDIYEVLRAEVWALGDLGWNPADANQFFVLSTPLQATARVVEPAPIQGGASRLYGTIRASGFIGRESYFSTYQITSATPRTAERFIYHVNRENFSSLEQLLQNALILDPYDTRISVRAIITRPSSTQVRETEQIEQLLEAVRAQRNMPVNRGVPLFVVRAEGAGADGNWLRAEIFFNSDIEEFLELHLVPEWCTCGWC